MVAIGCLLVVAVPGASAAGPPVIKLESATAGYVQIQVSGTVEPNGEETHIYGEFATTETGPFEFFQIGNIPAGASGPTLVSGIIKTGGNEKLKPGTEYFVRLDAETTEGADAGEHYSNELPVNTKAVAKPIVSINAPSGVGGRAIDLSGQINPNAPGPEGSMSSDEQAAFETSWHFECMVVGGLPGENDCPGLSGTVAADDTGHVVTAEAEGLPPNKNLEVELIASNAGGAASAGPQTLLTQDFARAISVSETAAVLYDEINPEGRPTTFHIDYGLTKAYGNSTPESSPIEVEGMVAKDSVPHPVQAALAGLQPGITYHWRVVTTNAGGTSFGSDHTFTTFATPAALGSGCANRAFRTGVGSALPDCRAYEQASPVDKNGGSVFGGIGLVQASVSGDRVTFKAPSGLPTTGGTSSFPLYVASRGADGWSTANTLPLGEPGQFFRLLGWDAELTSAISAGGPSGSASAAPGLYSGDIAAGTYSRIASLQSPPPLEGNYLAGGSANPSLFIMESREALAPGGVEGNPNLYEVNEGRFSSVGLIPSALATTCAGASCVPAAGGSFAGPYSWINSDTAHGGGANFGGANENFYTENAISRDGTKIFFTAAGSGQLYLREHGTRTIWVSASQKSSPDPGLRPAAFVAATPDGSKVFFLSCEKLTDGSTAESSSSTETCGGAKEGQDLYSFDTSTGELTDLTEDHGPTAAETHGAAVKGLVGISEDGSFAYFVANGVLTGSQENGNGEHAEPGTCTSDPENEGKNCNLYLAHGGKVVFVARLSQGPAADSTDWVPYVLNEALKESRVATSGTLLFAAKESLTGYDNSLVAGGGANCRKHGAPSPTCEQELYRYRPGDGQLACVSCSPANAAPDGSAVLESPQSGFSEGPRMIVRTRNLADGGSRIFFDSPDSLVPADTNGVVDPYEWEAIGTGSCQTAIADGGCLYLLSSGKSPHSSFLADVSASGDDAFFFTAQSLVPADDDENLDVYDARVEGGLQSQYPPAAPEPCVGEACLGAAGSPSTVTAPGTSSFVGPGNPKPNKCAKSNGKANRKGCRQPKRHKKHKGDKKHPKHAKKKHGAGQTRSRSGAGNGNRGGSK
jgi:hypothetical protein